MKRRRSTDRDRKEWLAQAEQWDGRAVVTDPWNRCFIDADAYKRHVCEPVMADHDRLPSQCRALAVEGKEIPAPPQMGGGW